MCESVCRCMYIRVCFTVGPPLKFSGGLSVVLEPDSVHVQCVCESNGHSLFRIQAVYQERRDFYTISSHCLHIQQHVCRASKFAMPNLIHVRFAYSCLSEIVSCTTVLIGPCFIHTSGHMQATSRL